MGVLASFRPRSFEQLPFDRISRRHYTISLRVLVWVDSELFNETSADACEQLLEPCSFHNDSDKDRSRTDRYINIK